MNLQSDKKSLIILVITSLILSRIMFALFNDPEGPNLLIVTVMAAIVYFLSKGIIFLLSKHLLNLSGTKKLLSTILIQIIIIAGFYFGLNIEAKLNKEEKIIQPDVKPVEYITYKNTEYGPQFTYPKSWGEVTIKEGNKTCPEEDTYRTQDTLHLFDQEFSFSQKTLPGSESMIRSGIRTYKLDPKNLGDCGQQFLWDISQNKFDPRTLSSVILTPITNKSGLSGIYNPEASRLNTEHRTQYTFFVPSKEGYVQVIQPYLSFIPYFGSPELKEMEEKFNGNMKLYIEQGITSQKIREYIKEFADLAEGLNFIF